MKIFELLSTTKTWEKQLKNILNTLSAAAVYKNKSEPIEK